MMMTCSKSDDTRGDRRRHQILAAAARCFSEHGFHGTGIARICDAAGMSPGHVYHYFENKESIIAAIVEQSLEQTLASTAAIRETNDDEAALSAQLAKIVQRHLSLETGRLYLEVIAEAARNPRVAAIVRTADERARSSIETLLRNILRSSAGSEEERDLSATVEMILLILDGLRIRCIRNPDVERGTVTQIVNNVLRDLLSPRQSAAPKPRLTLLTGP